MARMLGSFSSEKPKSPSRCGLPRFDDAVQQRARGRTSPAEETAVSAVATTTAFLRGRTMMDVAGPKLSCGPKLS